MSESESSTSSEPPLNWTVVGALYAALSLGILWMLYWGEYRNVVWLILIGMGGACSAYGRVLSHREKEEGELWQWAGALFYLVFFLWAGTVLFRQVGT